MQYVETSISNRASEANILIAVDHWLWYKEMCHDRNPTEHASVRQKGKPRPTTALRTGSTNDALWTFGYLSLYHFRFSFSCINSPIREEHNGWRSRRDRERRRQPCRQGFVRWCCWWCCTSVDWWVNFGVYGGVVSRAYETTERARNYVWFKNMSQTLLPGFDGKKRFWKKPNYVSWQLEVRCWQFIHLGQPFGKKCTRLLTEDMWYWYDVKDIVKVRLQTTTQYSGAADAASKILKNEGAAAFYKGTLTPLIGIGACVSITFTSSLTA
jgi:hypothetical protein